jgi:hypothetical protein
MPRFLAKYESNPPRRRRALSSPFVVLILALVCAIIAHLLVGSGSNPPTVKEDAVAARKADSTNPGNVRIRKPAGPPRVNTGLLDPHGQPVSIACNTCHGNWTANSEARVGQRLERFHQHLHGNHGSLACVACHNSNDGYTTLRLADGKAVAFPEVMQLCAQCHGPQYRDYQHGSHGGMTGYWDLSRGSRERNNCVDCHNPHTPRYPVVQPAKGPNDRFLKGSGHE